MYPSGLSESIVISSSTSGCLRMYHDEANHGSSLRASSSGTPLLPRDNLPVAGHERRPRKSG